MGKSGNTGNLSDKKERSREDKLIAEMLKRAMEDPELELNFFKDMDVTVPPVAYFISQANNK